jgi:cytochrome o ubiquinol oxidase subunit IV
MIDRRHGWNVSFKPLTLGFILSLILLIAAYRIVTHVHLSSSTLIWALFIFAVVQAVIQLIFFLHLCLEEKPAWNLLTFLFMVLVVVVVFGGSLWIMSNLDYNTMSP